LVLQAEAEALKRAVDRRFVYVFSIDSFGDSTLLFPRIESGHNENRVPYDMAGQEALPTEIPLGVAKLVTVGPPFGVDSYILLTSREPIPNPGVLEFQRVRTCSPKGRNDTPLAKLSQISDRPAEQRTQ
jgi:hypothetical protein